MEEGAAQEGAAGVAGAATQGGRAGDEGGAESSRAHLYVFTSDKAGMAKVDREAVNRVVDEMSRGSKFVAHAEAKDRRTMQSIEEIRDRLRGLDDATLSRTERRIDEEVAPELIARSQRARGLASLPLEGSAHRVPPVCVVVDMDMFYAAVAIRENPALRTKPIAVGGIGMISTANYVARAYGVRSAMPGFIAKRLCPELIFVKHDFALYQEVAEQARAVFRRYDPHCRYCSLDEAFLDLTAAVRDRLGGAAPDSIGQGGDREIGPSVGLTMPPLVEGGAAGWGGGPAGPKAEDPGGPGDSEDPEDPENAENPESLGSLESPEAPPSPANPGDPSDPEDPDDPAGAAAFLARVEGAAAAIVRQIRDEVRAATGGLTCSAGIAGCTLLAKIASDVRKPDGQHLVGLSRRSGSAFLRDLSVRKVGGIGKVMQRVLSAGLGVETVGDLFAQRARVRLALERRKSSAAFLLRVALALPTEDEEQRWTRRGLGRAGAGPPGTVTRKGISCERTFAALSDAPSLLKKLSDICGTLSAHMSREALRGRSLTLKLKRADFAVRTLSATAQAGRAFATAEEMEAAARPLLLGEMDALRSKGARLMGVRVSNFLNRFVAPEADQATIDGFARSAKRNWCPNCGTWISGGESAFFRHLDEDCDQDRTSDSDPDSPPRAAPPPRAPKRPRSEQLTMAEYMMAAAPPQARRQT